MRRLPAALALLALPLLACTGDFFKSCTAWVVGSTVKTTKEVGSGVVEGIAEGRKAGASVDGAVLVGSMSELAAHGDLRVQKVEPAGEGACKVVLALENRGEAPLRFLNLEVVALDSDGFLVRPSGHVPGEATVPPRAKDRLEVEFPIAAERVGVVRVWSVDLPPAG